MPRTFDLFRRTELTSVVYLKSLFLLIAKLLEFLSFACYNCLNQQINGENMTNQTTLNEYLQVLVGERLEKLNLVCEMMAFTFENYSLHSTCLTRIIQENDILVTTADYQNWDEKVDAHNDEWFFVDKYKDKIIGGMVTSVRSLLYTTLKLFWITGLGLSCLLKTVITISMAIMNNGYSLVKTTVFLLFPFATKL